MLKRIKSNALIIIGALIGFVSLIAGLIGFPKPGFGRLKISIIVFGIVLVLIGFLIKYLHKKGKRLISLTHQESTLLGLGLFFGLLMCVFIPFMAGFDEVSHLARSFEISKFHLLPDAARDSYLSQFIAYSYQQNDYEGSAQTQFAANIFLDVPNWDHTIVRQIRSSYFPLNYIIPALISRIFWFGLNMPVIPVVILMRLTGLLIYLLACLLTLRMLPVGKWLFVALALSPMALFQASTINADWITNAAAFLFIGYLLKLAADKQTPVDLKKTWGIVGLSILIGCVKPGTILLYPLLVILAQNKFSSKKLVPLIITGALLGIGISYFWTISTSSSVTLTGNTTLSGKALFALQNFPDFIAIFFKGIFLSLGTYFKDWVGVYGYWVGKVPVLTYIFYPLALAAAFLTEDKKNKLSAQNRVIALIVSLICLIGIASFQFVLHYSPGVQSLGAQGRYFEPFVPLLAIPLAGSLWKNEKWTKRVRLFAIIFLLAALLTYGYGIYRTYYTRCVYAVTPTQPCQLPKYKNLDVRNPFMVKVDNQSTVWQSIKVQCKEISSFSVITLTSSGNDTDTLRISLFDSNYQMISSEEYAYTSLKDREQITLTSKISISPENDLFWLKFEPGANNSVESYIELFGRKNKMIYSDGQLLSNSQELDGDLVFTYTCTVP